MSGVRERDVNGASERERGERGGVSVERERGFELGVSGTRE